MAIAIAMAGFAGSPARIRRPPAPSRHWSLQGRALTMSWKRKGHPMPWGRQSPCRTPQGAKLSILVHSSKGGCSGSRPPLRGFAGERPGPEQPSSEVLHAETKSKGSGHCSPSTRGCQSSVRTAALPFQEQTPSRAPVRMLGTPAEEAPPERTGAPRPGGVGSASTRSGGTRPVSGCRSSEQPSRKGPSLPSATAGPGVQSSLVRAVSDPCRSVWCQLWARKRRCRALGEALSSGHQHPVHTPACLSGLPGTRPSLSKAGPALPLPWDSCCCIVGLG